MLQIMDIIERARPGRATLEARKSQQNSAQIGKSSHQAFVDLDGAKKAASNRHASVNGDADGVCGLITPPDLRRQRAHRYRCSQNLISIAHEDSSLAHTDVLGNLSLSMCLLDVKGLVIGFC